MGSGTNSTFEMDVHLRLEDSLSLREILLDLDSQEMDFSLIRAAKIEETGKYDFEIVLFDQDDLLILLQSPVSFDLISAEKREEVVAAEAAPVVTQPEPFVRPCDYPWTQPYTPTYPTYPGVGTGDPAPWEITWTSHAGVPTETPSEFDARTQKAAKDVQELMETLRSEVQECAGFHDARISPHPQSSVDWDRISPFTLCPAGTAQSQ